jgi:hypothetical protein
MNSRQSLKRLLLAALMLTALPVSAFAQTSRVEGMHVQGDYIKDYTGIYTYTSGVTNVGNLVYGELGNINGFTTLDRSVGVVLGNLWDGRLGTWAIHLREETPQLGQGDAFSSPAPGSFGFDPNVHTNESFDLMWGKKFGTTSIGLRLNRSYFKFQEDLAGVTTELEFDAPSAFDPNFSRNIIGFGGGLGFEMNPNTNIELNVLYQNRTFTNDDPGVPVDTESDGPATYQVAARMMWMYQPNWMIVPVFKWYNYDLSVQDNATSTTAEGSLSGWQLGAASNWTLGANDLLVVGLTVAQNKIDDEGGVTGFGPDAEFTETFTPQIFAALETHVNSWLTFRFGAEKGVMHHLEFEETTTPVTQEQDDSPFSMSLGTGVKLGSLQLDAILSDIFPHTLGWIGSGIPGVYFPKVTATYAF